MVARMAPDSLRLGDQVVFTSNGEDRRGTLAKVGLDGNAVEVRITEGPGAGGLVRIDAGSVRSATPSTAPAQDEAPG
jgi:hypothetical protein